jgi:phosphoenolpyruvate synthase/pyruvate phosphate dikinase
MIYRFVFDLEEIKIKLTSEDYNEYAVAIGNNKKLKQWIMILMIILEGIVLVLNGLEQFTNSFNSIMLSNITEVILSLFLIVILIFMINKFLRLAYFFRV